MNISRVRERLLHHWRAGTLGKSLAARLGFRGVDDKVRWFGADTEREAELALISRAQQQLSNAPESSQMLIVCEQTGLGQSLAALAQEKSLPHRVLGLAQALDLKDSESSAIAIIICADIDARLQTQAARALANHPVLGSLPFEHASGLDSSRAIFKQLDEYAGTDFVSPVLLDQPTPYAIYQESLHYFEQKCGLRDYLDLYQLLRSVVENQVPGDIAEFGSFRGHSGWLIARSLQALGSDKKLFMFDTFESFPQETYGVDHFWSATHTVNFEEVKAKFENLKNVTLIRGDFTETLASSPMEKLALAYIDCDSYRATRYLLETLPDSRLSSQSILVCEDYGHPALLGNRVAVHEVFDGVPGWFRFFSQFSGLYVMVKQ